MHDLGMYVVCINSRWAHSLGGETVRTVTTSTNYPLSLSISRTNNDILPPFLLQNKDKRVLEMPQF